EPQATSRHQKMVVRWGHDHSTLAGGRYRLAVFGVGDRNPGLSTQPLGESRSEGLPNMEDQQNRSRQPWRKAPQDLEQGSGPSRRGTDGDELLVRSPGRYLLGKGILRGWSASGEAGAHMRDDLDTRRHAHPRDQLAVPVTIGLGSFGLVEHVERAGR